MLHKDYFTMGLWSQLVCSEPRLCNGHSRASGQVAPASCGSWPAGVALTWDAAISNSSCLHCTALFSGPQAASEVGVETPRTPRPTQQVCHCLFCLSLFVACVCGGWKAIEKGAGHAPDLECVLQGRNAQQIPCLLGSAGRGRMGGWSRAS